MFDTTTNRLADRLSGNLSSELETLANRIETQAGEIANAQRELTGYLLAGLALVAGIALVALVVR